MDNPKLFISYSWSNPEHIEKVIQLATELRDSGVDAILDKWDLKEGNDAIVFMEQMVNDPEIKKVLLVCDKIYAEKANKRKGGVGTEAQIISAEVYEKQDQNKFVAAVMEMDENGKACLPTYYKARVYIDLSEPDKYAANFEQLLRWIYDEPLHKKPEIGKTPAFLDEITTVMPTTASFNRTIDAIRNGKSHASGSLDEYLHIFSENLEKFRIVEYSGEFDDAVVKNIDSFEPYKNQLVELFFAIGRYASSEEYINKLHHFFERLIPYLFRPANISQDCEWDYDNFKFIVHEAFLYLIAILIQQDRFEEANCLMERPYYSTRSSDYGNKSVLNFNIFSQHMQSLTRRNSRLSRGAVRAEILKQRCAGTGLDFTHLMQADFVLFLRSSLESEDEYWTWWPETLVYLGHFPKQFEIFARAVSKKYFDTIKCLFAINVPKDLEKLLVDFQTNKRRLPQWSFAMINPAFLIGYDRLATKP